MCGITGPAQPENGPGFPSLAGFLPVAETAGNPPGGASPPRHKDTPPAPTAVSRRAGDGRRGDGNGPRLGVQAAGGSDQERPPSANQYGGREGCGPPTAGLQRSAGLAEQGCRRPQHKRSGSGDEARLEIQRRAMCPVGNGRGDGFQHAVQRNHVRRPFLREQGRHVDTVRQEL